MKYLKEYKDGGEGFVVYDKAYWIEDQLIEDNIENVNKYDINLVEKMFDNVSKDKITTGISAAIEDDGSDVKVSYYITATKYKFAWVVIYRLVDDWFLVKFNIDTDYLPKWNPKEYSYRTYKCDQSDGLKNCLQTIIDRIEEVKIRYGK